MSEHIPQSDGKTPIGTYGDIHRQILTYNQIPQILDDAVMAAEDRSFMTEGGISPTGIMRAAWDDITGNSSSLSGGSTITQEFVRQYYAGIGTQQTASRKIKEIFVSAELSRRFTKEEILELYLNQIYYGNLAYGIEAAAQTYFDKPASDLNLAEASFLAGIPQTPAVWDPVTNLGDPGDPEAPPGVLDRQEAVVRLMVEAGGDGCVGPMADNTTICVTRDNITAQAEDFIEIRNTEFEPPRFGARTHPPRSAGSHPPPGRRELHPAPLPPGPVPSPGPRRE